MVSPLESVGLLTTRPRVDAVQYGEEHSGLVPRGETTGPGVTRTSDPNRPAIARNRELNRSTVACLRGANRSTCCGPGVRWRSALVRNALENLRREPGVFH